MKHVVTFVVSVVAGSILLALATVARAATIPDGSPVSPVGSPRSTFISDAFEPGFGRDPFFPKTQRFVKKAPKEEEDRPPVEQLFPEITLRGISLEQGRKLAILNNTTLGEGEELTLKFNGKLVKAKCVEIKEKSVLVAANGTTKEILLRAALQ
jgi:hypothetical protein